MAPAMGTGATPLVTLVQVAIDEMDIAAECSRAFPTPADDTPMSAERTNARTKRHRIAKTPYEAALQAASAVDLIDQAKRPFDVVARLRNNSVPGYDFPDTDEGTR